MVGISLRFLLFAPIIATVFVCSLPFGMIFKNPVAPLIPQIFGMIFGKKLSLTIGITTFSLVMPYLVLSYVRWFSLTSVRILLLMLCMLTALWFFMGWSSGVAHQGAQVVYLSFALNCLALGLVLLIAHSPFARNPACEDLLVFLIAIWLAGVAFPWLGETP